MNPIILYENIFENGTLAATSTAAGYSVDNLIDGRSYTKWKATGATTQYITVALSGADNAKMLGIYNHNLGTIGATVKVQADVAATWEDAVVINPTDDKPILVEFDSAGFNSEGWRIEISGVSAAAEIGIAMIGDRLEFPWPPDTPTVPAEEGTVSSNLINKAGHLIGTDIKYHPVNTPQKFSMLLRSWVTTYFNPFYHNYGKKQKTFFYAWDLDNAADDIYLCRLDPDMVYYTPLTISTYVDMIELRMKSVNEIY